ncbi:hypothetical protein [Devosia epidermidihirudinis]|nr:hypothetical protein [Devosia epidermidihirudinis]
MAATAFVTILVGLAVFQAALASGAPLGEFAWGGQSRVLPPRLRGGSVVAILLYGVFAAIIMQRADIVSLLPGGDWLGVACWFVVGYCALGIPLNAISRSRKERLVMTPLVAVLFVLSLVVAWSA